MKEELLELGRKLVREALRLGYDESAALIRTLEESMVKIANSEPSVMQSWRNLSISVYLEKNKRIFTFESQPSSIEKAYGALQDLMKLADKITESPFYAPFPEPRRVELLEGTTDHSVLEAMHDPSSIAGDVIERAHSQGNIDHVAGMISLRYFEKALVSSKDHELYEDSTMVESYIRAFAGEASGQWALGSRRLNREKLLEMASMASRLASDARKPEEVEPGVYDLILSPMVAGNLFNYIARMSNAFSMIIGMSMFVKNKPGDEVASRKLTLIDDARNVDLPGATSFDDEGVQTFSKPIIENGVLKNLLHNSKTAARMKAELTGNAGWVMPHPWALRVVEGDASLEEMVSEVKSGLLVNNNWYTRLQNYIEGMFSTITRDALFLIRNGEIVGAAKKLRIADTFPRLLKNIDLLGGQTYDIRWWEVNVPVRTPYVLVRGVKTSKHTA